MSRQIEDGELCPSCGEIPIAFYGYDKAECPICGERLQRFGADEDVESEDDDDEGDEDEYDLDDDEADLE
jgi:hypothetical protein